VINITRYDKEDIVTMTLTGNQEKSLIILTTIENLELLQARIAEAIKYVKTRCDVPAREPEAVYKTEYIIMSEYKEDDVYEQRYLTKSKRWTANDRLAWRFPDEEACKRKIAEINPTPPQGWSMPLVCGDEVEC
jgi:hypothetical protein